MLIKLLTYNIHKCVGGLDRKYLPDRVRDTIAHHDPDFVLLQEVTEGVAGLRQVDLLGDKLDLHHRTFFPNAKIRGGGFYGNAILSRYPLTSTRNIDLKVLGGKKRSALHARFKVSREGRTRMFHVFNIHLGLTQFLRDRQMKKFLASPQLRHVDPRTPMVLAGDFNDVWGNLGRKHLEPAGFRGMEKRLRTFPSWAPVHSLDWVYVRGDVNLLDVSRSTFEGARWASDHLPLIAEVKLA